MRALAFACLLAATLTAAPGRVPGLEKQVEILRDKWGVPHIYASTEHDLFFSQEYITAQDRLFQIDLWRRAGRAASRPAGGAEDHTARSAVLRAYRQTAGAVRLTTG